MEPRDLEIAAELCRLVQSSDLLAYLGLDDGCTVEEAHAALSARRKRMQSMQSNPKYREAARYLIKNMNPLKRVLEDPQVYAAHMARLAEEAKLPQLELAINSILVDGVVTPEEEAFARESAVDLGISMETFERVLHELADKAGVDLEARRREPTQKLRGAEGHAWWDANFTRMLLEVIPSGPGDMIDIYCRTGLSAATLLPERPEMSWLGVDRSEERLEEVHKNFGAMHGRLGLAQAPPWELPAGTESIDIAVGIRALANVPDTQAVFSEAWRVLRPGGRMVVAEPDGRSETFYFDGHLTAFNAAFQALCAAADDAHGTGEGSSGIALGPKLAARLRSIGFSVNVVKVHASQNLRPRPWAKLASRMRKYSRAIARAVGLEGGPELAAVLEEVDLLDAQFDDDRVGLCGNVLPIFLTVGNKPSED